MFLSCYKNGIVPLLSVGPHWPLTLLFIGSMGFMLTMFVQGVYELRERYPGTVYIITSLVYSNVLVFLKCFLGDPGVDENVYKK